MTHPLLCATVAAASIDDLRRQRDEAGRLADLVELRLDALPRPDVEGALAGRRVPVIVTCRPRWEGGGFDGAEEARLGLLHRAAKLGAEYVDIEWRARDEAFVRSRGGRGIVLSMHDFEGTPTDLGGVLAAMHGARAEVVKLAVTARSLTDCLRLAETGRQAARAGARTALVAMGPSGVPSRLLPARFGSCWTYAGEAIAPGQVALDRLLGEFRFHDVTDSTRIYGVAGRPLGHSLSPAMHNAAFAACGLDAVYVPLETADVDDLLAFAAGLQVEGVSVTAPLKVAVLQRAGEADPTSRAVGAANTLRWREGRWEARNTDVPGFLAPLAGDALDGVRTAVLGTGGAARAVVAALASRGARVVVYGRQIERAGALAALAGGEGRVGLPPAGTWDLLVNATPVGTAPDVGRTLMAGGDLRGGRLVYDLVYNPQRTALLRDAEAAGCRVVGGLDMLVAQAAAQFQWWTGLDAPLQVMRDAASARLTAMTGAA